MKIEARCNTCGRNFVLGQIGPESDAPGRCPFCGTHFARHYASLLVEAVSDTERNADVFARSLSRLQDIDTGFDIDVDGFWKEIAKLVRTPASPSAG